MASSSRNDSENNLVPPSKNPGERMGLPQTGPRSVGRFGRRILAFLVDGLIANLLMILITQTTFLVLFNRAQDALEAYQESESPARFEQAQTAATALQSYQLGVIGIFIIFQILGVWTLHGSLGHRIMGMYVVDVLGRKLAWWRPIVRTVLLVLVIPALVWDSDQRGFHDKLAGTILLRAK